MRGDSIQNEPRERGSCKLKLIDAMTGNLDQPRTLVSPSCQSRTSSKLSISKPHAMIIIVLGHGHPEGVLGDGRSTFVTFLGDAFSARRDSQPHLVYVLVVQVGMHMHLHKSRGSLPAWEAVQSLWP